ncbi:hypothetical protein GQ457_11G000020 [Hibiscus cannabinus]
MALNRTNEFEKRGDLGDLDKQSLDELRNLKLGFWDYLKVLEETGMVWLKQGDFNTKFFHKVVKMRAKRNLIRGVNLGLLKLDDPPKLKQAVFDYFQHQYNVKARKWEPVLQLDFKKLTEEESEALESPFTLEEFKEAVWSCNEGKVPDPDGFNAAFYKKCWKQVKEELLKRFKILELIYKSYKVASEYRYHPLGIDTPCKTQQLEYVFNTEYRYPSLSIDTPLLFTGEYQYPKSSIDTLCCRSAFIAGRKLPNGSIDDLTYQNFRS